MKCNGMEWNGMEWNEMQCASGSVAECDARAGMRVIHNE